MVKLLKKICLIFICFLQYVTAYASNTTKCNEKFRQQIMASAKVRCAGMVEDGIWSEHVFNASEDQAAMDVIFSFKCKDGKDKGKRFLGLVKISPKSGCVIGVPEISNVSVLSDKPLSK